MSSEDDANVSGVKMDMRIMIMNVMIADTNKQDANDRLFFMVLE